MPFTVAHPAAVAPIWLVARRRLPLPALVIGAMSPDFEYLLRLAPRGDLGHDLIGLFVFCLPATLVCLLVFETVVRAPLARLLALPPRFANGPERNAAWWAGAAVAAVLGAATHVVWDGVTHGDGWIVSAIPELREKAIDGMRWTSLLQRMSTLIGAAGIVAWLAASRDVRRAVRDLLASPERLGTLGALLAAACAVALLNGVRAVGIPPDRGDLLRFLAWGAVGGMDGLAAAIVGYSLRDRSSRRAPLAREAFPSGRRV